MRGGKKGCAYPSSVALWFKGIDPFLCVGRHAETSSHIHEGEWSAGALCTSTLMEKNCCFLLLNILSSLTAIANLATAKVLLSISVKSL